MASNGKFQPGQSGNPATQFKAGNRHRWQPGQSGNPAGIARSRLQFKESSSEAFLGYGSADEVANLLCEAVRKREPWAIQVLQRVAREAKENNIPRVRRNRTAVKLPNDPVVPAPAALDSGGDSRAADRLATPAVDGPTRAHDAEADSSRRDLLKQRYDEFCVTKVKDRLRAVPAAILSQCFQETRSDVRRALPELRRNELDEMAQRELESKIRAGLHLPSIEEFAARSV